MDSNTLVILGALALAFLFVLVLVALRIVRRRRAAGEPPPKKVAARKRPAKQSPPPKETPVDGKTPVKTTDTSTQILAGAPRERALPPQPKQAFAPAGEKIRILIVDDNTGTRENVSRLLYFEDDLEVIGQAVNGREGVEMTAQLKPHIVLMDINMPDMDGITATGEMATKSPYSQVIIMSVQADQHYMKRAMAAGARDFQPKPFTSQELVACIRRVYNIGLPVYRQFEALENNNKQKEVVKKKVKVEKAEAPVIAVYSPKGGTGVSAIATNLAVVLQQAQGDTVLFDGSLQFGDVSVHLNTRPNTTVVDMIHEGQLEADLINDVLLAHSSGLKLLMAPAQPELAEAITGPMISDVLAALKEQFKAVVVDTSCQLSDASLAIFDSADCVLVVLTPELPAIKSAKLFLELVQNLNFKDKQVFVVINRADFPGGVKPHQIEKVLRVQQTYQIPYDPRIIGALARGAPVVLEDATAPAAVAIRALANVVKSRVAAPETEPEGVV